MSATRCTWQSLGCCCCLGRWPTRFRPISVKAWRCCARRSIWGTAAAARSRWHCRPSSRCRSRPYPRLAALCSRTVVQRVQWHRQWTLGGAGSAPRAHPHLVASPPGRSRIVHHGRAGRPRQSPPRPQPASAARAAAARVDTAGTRRGSGHVARAVCRAIPTGAGSHADGVAGRLAPEPRQGSPSARTACQGGGRRGRLFRRCDVYARIRPQRRRAAH